MDKAGVPHLRIEWSPCSFAYQDRKMPSPMQCSSRSTLLLRADGFVDCACLNDAEQVKSADPSLSGIRLHRCLQHTRQNFNQNARRRDEISGELRVTNTELVPLMGGWLMQSALLPSTLEFSSFWQSLLARLRGSQASTDWDEPLFADYLEKCLLGRDVHGLTTASWRFGHGSECSPGLHDLCKQYPGENVADFEGLVEKRGLANAGVHLSCDCRTLASVCKYHNPPCNWVRSTEELPSKSSSLCVPCAFLFSIVTRHAGGKAKIQPLS